MVIDFLTNTILAFIPIVIWLIRQLFASIYKHKEDRKIRDNYFLFILNIFFIICGFIGILSGVTNLTHVKELQSQQILDTFKLLFSNNFIAFGGGHINSIPLTEYQDFFEYFVIFGLCIVILINIYSLVVLHKDLNKPYKRFYILLLFMSILWSIMFYEHNYTDLFQESFENAVIKHNAKIDNQRVDGIYDISIEGEGYVNFSLYLFDKDGNISVINRDSTSNFVAETDKVKIYYNFAEDLGGSMLDYSFIKHYTFIVKDKHTPIYFYLAYDGKGPNFQKISSYDIKRQGLHITLRPNIKINKMYQLKNNTIKEIKDTEIFNLLNNKKIQ